MSLTTNNLLPPANNNNLAQMDRQTVLHPFVAIRAFEENDTGGARTIQTGQGIRISVANGATSIGGFAGFYCANISYSREQVANAIAERYIS